MPPIVHLYEIGQNIANKAASHVGEHEQPMGSNTGPEVDAYLAYVGLSPGQPWCAAFACSMVYRTLVGMDLTTYYHPKTGSTHEVLYWGQANGTVMLESAPAPGDLGCLIYDASHGHTVICVGQQIDGIVPTVEGNFNNAVERNTRRIASMTWIRPYKLII